MRYYVKKARHDLGLNKEGVNEFTPHVPQNYGELIAPHAAHLAYKKYPNRKIWEQELFTLTLVFHDGSEQDYEIAIVPQDPLFKII